MGASRSIENTLTKFVVRREDLCGRRRVPLVPVMRPPQHCTRGGPTRERDVHTRTRRGPQSWATRAPHTCSTPAARTVLLCAHAAPYAWVAALGLRWVFPLFALGVPLICVGCSHLFALGVPLFALGVTPCLRWVSPLFALGVPPCCAGCPPCLRWVSTLFALGVSACLGCIRWVLSTV